MADARSDVRVDQYIADAQKFAKPILIHVRALVHQARPDVEEAMKWGMPFFTLRGKNLANMAAFKEHAVFGFWEGLNIETPKSDEAMGHYGRITRLDDLPGDQELMDLIIEVAKKMEQSASAKPKAARKKRVTLPPMPEDFGQAIAGNAKAKKTWDDFAPSHKRDYLEWVIEAKREATRVKRMKQAVEWMAEGKDRNWKYR